MLAALRDLITGTPVWVWLFFLAGVAATANVVLALFFNVGRRPPQLYATERPSVGSHEFLDALSGLLNLPVECGGRARVLQNGDAFFAALLDDIGRARHHVHFMTYIWREGRASDRVFDALVERARAGVEVRLMLDGVGGIAAPPERIEELTGAGGQVQHFRPPKFGKLTRFHKRNHRRAIVIDGAIAYTGGMAVQDCWLGDARNEDEWRDSMVRVEGPPARGVQSAFTELWAGTTGELVIGDDYYVPRGDAGPGLPQFIALASSPAHEKHPLRLFFHLSFMAAMEELFIVTPYFAPDRNTRAALADRARAGVDVRVLLPNRLIDVTIVRWGARSHYEELLSAGIRIFEYQPTMIHTKAVIVDGRWSIVGSANLDVRSKELNKENVLGILDKEIGSQLRASFLADLERAAEIRLDIWRRRGVLPRLKEKLALPFSEQF
jgi:cardiolipin synthase A/B